MTLHDPKFKGLKDMGVGGETLMLFHRMRQYIVIFANDKQAGQYESHSLEYQLQF